METVEALMEGLEEATTAQKEAVASLNELIRKFMRINSTLSDVRMQTFVNCREPSTQRYTTF